ncbi:MAG: hypothetical protein U1E17_04135 [Geminicoccaceae bacterium]
MHRRRALRRSIRKGLTRLETLIGEAARERRSRLVRGPDLAPLLRTLLRLRRSRDAAPCRRPARWDAAVRDRLASPWTQAAIAGAARLRDLGQALAHGQPPAAGPALARTSPPTGQRSTACCARTAGTAWSPRSWDACSASPSASTSSAATSTIWRHARASWRRPATTG